MGTTDEIKLILLRGVRGGEAANDSNPLNDLSELADSEIRAASAI